MNDLMGNHLDFALIDLGGAAMLIREKKLRALEVTGEAVKRVMTSEETINTLHKPRGTEPLPITASQLQTIQIEEIERFRSIAKTVNFSHK